MGKILLDRVSNFPGKLKLHYNSQLWNFVGFVLYTGAGVISAITWTNAKNADDDLGDKARNYDAALTMSAFCLLQGLIYFVDFIFAKRARNRILEDGY